MRVTILDTDPVADSHQITNKKEASGRRRLVGKIYYKLPPRPVLSLTHSPHLVLYPHDTPACPP